MITKTKPRPWTAEDIKNLKDLKKRKYSLKTIAFILERSEVAVQIKWKRLHKKDESYNIGHLEEKYNTNKEFISKLRPDGNYFKILDLYAGKSSYYKEISNINLISNDKEYPGGDYQEDALKVLCSLYSEGASFDVIDLDPFGSAYECFDLSLKMASKGIIITYGEMGHLRWKRLDYVERFYNINTLEEFTIERLIEETNKIAKRNKKVLIPIFVKKWRNISRVYYIINKYKIDVWRTRGK